MLCQFNAEIHCIMIGVFSPKSEDKQALGQAIIDAYPLLRCATGSGYVSSCKLYF